MNSYIYLIQDGEFINTNVYKVGRTSQKDDTRTLSRIKSYNKYTVQKYLREVNSSYVIKIETDIKRILKSKYTLVKGTEWFEGDHNMMIEIINFTINKYIIYDTYLETNNLETNNLETNNLETNNLETNNLETNNLETNNLETNNIKINNLAFINELTYETWSPTFRDDQEIDNIYYQFLEIDNIKDNLEIDNNKFKKFHFNKFMDSLKINYNSLNIIIDKIDILPVSNIITELAKYISKKYHYKCISLNNKEWYIYKNYKWISIKNGINEINKIINNLSEDYEKLSLYYCKNIEETNNKDFINKSYEYGKIAFKLKINNNFKNNILKECIKLYYDDTFIEKLDKNNNLLHFLNGIYDLESNKLREGSPNDYISLSTNINFIHELNYDNHKKVNLVNGFLNMYNKKLMNFLANLLNGKYNNFYVLKEITYKTILINFLKNILGEYMTILSQKIFDNTNKNNLILETIKNKKCVLIEDELTLNKIVNKIINKNPIDIYKNYLSDYTFTTSFKLILIDNYKYCQESYTYKYDLNPIILDQYILDLNDSKIKNWNDIFKNIDDYKEIFMYILIQYYQENNKIENAFFIENNKIENVLNTSSYCSDSNIYKQFIKEFLQEDTNTTLGIDEVFPIFQGFLTQCGVNHTKHNRREFENCMSKIIGKPNNKKKWKGWKIAPNDEEEKLKEN